MEIRTDGEMHVELCSGVIAGEPTHPQGICTLKQELTE
jgi:hypothetical protein